jgi:uncharacterized membrane protein
LTAAHHPTATDEHAAETIPVAANAERLSIFSDGVFAVLITVLVLDLRPPPHASWPALIAIWPTAIGYAISYVFIAIIWVNHHHAMRFAQRATPRLIWANFGHLFAISLIPFSTAWIAESRLAPIPVFAYAAVLSLINASYMVLSLEVIGGFRRSLGRFSLRALLANRSVGTLLIFLLAGTLALWHPYAGFGLVCCCLLVYLRPKLPGRD